MKRRLSILAPILALAVMALAVFVLGRTAPEPVDGCPPDGGASGRTAPSASAPSTESPVPITPGPPAATATTAPDPPPAPVTDRLGELHRRMDETIRRHPAPGRYAVAVTDLQTGETVSVNGHRAQLAGCSINYFVLLQVTLDVQDGKYPLALVDGLVRATTWSSNAATALELYRIVGDGDALTGVARVDVLIRERLTLMDTVLNHPPAYAYAINLRDGDNWLSAIDANAALVALWRGDGMTPESRTYLLDRLATVEPGLNYLTGSVPGAVVSHKNGFFWYGEGYVDNDIGIVWLTSGDQEVAFAISFLSEAVPSMYADVALGKELIRLAVEHFSRADQ